MTTINKITEKTSPLDYNLNVILRLQQKKHKINLLVYKILSQEEYSPESQRLGKLQLMINNIDLMIEALTSEYHPEELNEEGFKALQNQLFLGERL